MTENFELSENIYQFIDKIPLDKENIKELVEYVHYKALLDSFTFIIENNNGADLDFLLTDYVEIVSKVQIIINNIKLKYEKNGTEKE